MKAINILGGLAGALALNLLHETMKRMDHDAPRVDLVGEEALSKLAETAGTKAPKGDALFTSTLLADVVTNTAYYSLIGVGSKKHFLSRGAWYGLVAGIGALALTKPMGLSDAPITKTEKTKLMTVGYYLLGGMVTAMTIKLLKK